MRTVQRESNSQATEGFGLHLTLDAYGAPEEKLSDIGLIRKTLLELPSLLKFTRISEPFIIWYDGGRKPEDEGITSMVMIAESHISIHTFPHKGFFTADIYSCSNFDHQVPLRYFKKTFGLKEMETNLVKRGLKFPRT